MDSSRAIRSYSLFMIGVLLLCGSVCIGLPVQPEPREANCPSLVISNHSTWSEFSPDGGNPILWQVFCTEQADAQLTGLWSFSNGPIGPHNSTKESYLYDGGICTKFSLQLFNVRFADSAGWYTISTLSSCGSHKSQTFLLSVSGCPCDDTHIPVPYLWPISKYIAVSNTSRNISLEAAFLGCADDRYYSVVVEHSAENVCENNMSLSSNYKCDQRVSNKCLFFQRIVIVDYSPEDSGDYCFSAVSVTGKRSYRSCIHIGIGSTTGEKFRDQIIKVHHTMQSLIDNVNVPHNLHETNTPSLFLYTAPSLSYAEPHNQPDTLHYAAAGIRPISITVGFVPMSMMCTAVCCVFCWRRGKKLRTWNYKNDRELSHCVTSSHNFWNQQTESIRHRHRTTSQDQLTSYPIHVDLPYDHPLTLPMSIPLTSGETESHTSEKIIVSSFIDTPVAGFMDFVETILCTNRGGIYHNPLHGITLHIPKGAVPLEMQHEVKIGVCLCDENFIFPQGLSPVSAIVWLCTDIQIDFLKPIEIIIPHFLECENDDAANLNMSFMKASHWDQADGNIQFHPAEGQADFTSIPNKGILHTNHFCYLCIVAPNSPKVLERQLFYLSCAVPRRIASWSDIYFYITYLNDTCYLDMENKLPEGYFIKERRVFKFSSVFLHRYISWFWGIPAITGKYDCSSAGTPVQVTMTLQPAEITMDNINFWKLHQEGVLEVLHKNKDYPPYMKLTFGELSLSEQLVVTMSFNGIQERGEATKIDIIVPSNNGDNSQHLSSESNTTTSQPAAFDIPRLNQLRMLKTRAPTSPIRLLEALAPQWETLGDTIAFDDIGNNVQLIKRECEREGPVACCRRVFQEWLIGKGGYQPPTWGNLIQLLEDIDQKNLAKALRDSLS